MSYPSIPGLRRGYDIDGTRVFYNANGGWAGAMTELSAAQKTSMNSAAFYTLATISTGQWIYFWALFPELVDLSALLMVWYGPGNPNWTTGWQWSADTTNGNDGTWTNLTFTSGLNGGANWNGSPYPAGLAQTSAGDWYRYPYEVGASGGAASPQTGVKAVRNSFNSSGGSNFSIQNFIVFGNKSSGQTPDDLVLYSDSGCTTPLTAQADLGNIAINGGSVTYTTYLKNVSATKTASNIALAMADKNSSEFTISIDGAVTFASTQTITTMTPGAVKRIDIRSSPTGTTYGSHVAAMTIEPALFS